MYPRPCRFHGDSNLGSRVFDHRPSLLRSAKVSNIPEYSQWHLANFHRGVRTKSQLFATELAFCVLPLESLIASPLSITTRLKVSLSTLRASEQLLRTLIFFTTKMDMEKQENKRLWSKRKTANTEKFIIEPNNNSRHHKRMSKYECNTARYLST